MLHEAIAFIGDTWSHCLCSEVYGHVATNYRCLTFTTTIDITVRIAGGRGITNSTTGNCHRSILKYVGLVTTAEDIQHTTLCGGLNLYFRIVVYR